MKPFKIAFLMVFLYSLAYGQDSKFAVGFNVTPTITSLKGAIKPPISFNNGNNGNVPTIFYGSQYSFSAGLSVEYFVCKHLSIKSGLAYERKGAQTYRYPMDDIIDGYWPPNNMDKKMNFDYLTLPILGSFSTKGKIKFYMDAGIFLGFLVSQKDIIAADGSNPELINNNYAAVRKLDFGLSLGLGLRMPLTKKLLLDFGLCNNTGLINVNKTYLSNDAVLRTNSMGFQFGLKYLF